MIDKFVTFCRLSFTVKYKGSAEALPLDYLGFLVFGLRFPQNFRISFGLNKIIVDIFEMPSSRRHGSNVLFVIMAAVLHVNADLF